jgi:hypothetical protein
MWEITDKAMRLATGAMRISVKNIGKGDAINAFVAGPQFKLVPEKKIGVPFFDDSPSVTDQTCSAKVEPKMKMFPVYAGKEVSIELRQSVGIVSLVKTNSVSVTLGGPQKEPETPPGEKPESVQIAKDAAFQLYDPICVYYVDRNGVQYGDCQLYRRSVDGNYSDERYAFSCPESPVTGRFVAPLGNYCDN